MYLQRNISCSLIVGGPCPISVLCVMSFGFCCRVTMLLGACTAMTTARAPSNISSPIVFNRHPFNQSQNLLAKGYGHFCLQHLIFVFALGRQRSNYRLTDVLMLCANILRCIGSSLLIVGGCPNDLFSHFGVFNYCLRSAIELFHLGWLSSRTTLSLNGIEYAAHIWA